jgi:hypothetical protein
MADGEGRGGNGASRDRESADGEYSDPAAGASVDGDLGESLGSCPSPSEVGAEVMCAAGEMVNHLSFCVQFLRQMFFFTSCDAFIGVGSATVPRHPYPWA